MEKYRGRIEKSSALEIRLTGDKIAHVESIPDDPGLPWLLPVLVDLQHNGALGRYYNELHEAPPEHLVDVANLLRRHGVGRCLLTLTTYPVGDLLKSARRINRWLSQDSSLNALFCGVFHEGIFVSPQEGWRGAHNLAWVRPPDYAHIRRIDEALNGRVRLVNVAPEEPGGLDFVAEAVSDGKIAAIGHSGADAETIRKALDRGASVVTHFGNGAPSHIHRHRNPFWTFLAEPGLRLGLIGDGFHLPRDLVRTVLGVKGPESCFLVSDASGYSGCPPGKYRCMGDRRFEIEPNGYMHLSDSEILSGAWFQLDRSVEFLVAELGLSLPAAWNLCSRVPAALAGIDLPVPAVGEEASFVLARWNEGLVLEQCVHQGHPCLDHPCRTTNIQ